MDILIGSIKHCDRDRIDIWVKSALKYVKARKVLICLDEVVPPSILELNNLGFEVIHYPTNQNSDVNVSKFDRHILSRKFLQSVEDNSIVLLTDTIDVVFQNDPFDWYRKNKNNKLLITSEGILVGHESWNMGGISNSFPYFVDEVRNVEVYNSGIIMGEVEKVKDLLLFIYNLSVNVKPQFTEGIDQPAMNVTLLSSVFKEITQFTTTDESFAVNCAVAGPTPQFVSWGFERNYIYNLPIFSDNGIVNKNGELYCIVHQYNRIEKWNNFFKEVYLDDKLKNYKKYSIVSENSKDHWEPFNFQDKVVLDLGCGRWYGVENYEQYSPIYFGKNGAKKVIGIDMSSSDIEYYKSNNVGNPIFEFEIQEINSPKDIEILIEKYEITAIKSDIEGAEIHLLNVDPYYFNNITDMAIEYHSKLIRDLFLEKLPQLGYTVDCIGNFTFANDSAGVIFAHKNQSETVKKLSLNRIQSTDENTAIVICTTAAFTAYYDFWKKELKYDKNEFILCDVSSNKLLPSNIILDFIQDNVINYTLDSVKSVLNFNTEPSSKHWWNMGGGRNIIWFYAHMRMLYFYKSFPDYEYYWFFDDDITFPKQQLYEFLNSHKDLKQDCLITYLFSNTGNENISEVPFIDNNMGSYHATNANWLIHYPGDGDKHPTDLKETYGSFFPIVRFSNRAMRALLEEHNKGYFGYSEGWVPSILNYKGLSLYSIFNQESKVQTNNNILIHHKFWEILWTNV